jgi:hypothetical protein
MDLDAHEEFGRAPGLSDAGHARLDRARDVRVPVSEQRAVRRGRPFVHVQPSIQDDENNPDLADVRRSSEWTFTVNMFENREDVERPYPASRFLTPRAPALASEGSYLNFSNVAEALVQGLVHSINSAYDVRSGHPVGRIITIIARNARSRARAFRRHRRRGDSLHALQILISVTGITNHGHRHTWYGGRIRNPVMISLHDWDEERLANDFAEGMTKLILMILNRTFTRESSDARIDAIENVQVSLVPIFNNRDRDLIERKVPTGMCNRGKRNIPFRLPDFGDVYLVSLARHRFASDADCGLEVLVKEFEELRKKKSTFCDWQKHSDALRKGMVMTNDITGGKVLMRIPYNGCKVTNDQKLFFTRCRQLFGIDPDQALSPKQVSTIAKKVFHINCHVLHPSKSVTQEHALPMPCIVPDYPVIRIYLYKNHYWYRNEALWKKLMKQVTSDRKKGKERKQSNYKTDEQCLKCRKRFKNLKNHKTCAGIGFIEAELQKNHKRFKSDHCSNFSFNRCAIKLQPEQEENLNEEDEKEVKKVRDLASAESKQPEIHPSFDEKAETYIEHMSQYMEDNTEEQKCTIFSVQGSAGTGKTYFIKSLVNKLITKNGFLPSSIFCVAHTGSATANLRSINLPTSNISTMCMLQVNHKRSPKDNSLLSQLKVLIIDEVSFILINLLKWIDETLREVNDLPDEPFGGCYVVLVGDFYQLPPVQMRRETKHLFEHSFFMDVVMPRMVSYKLTFNHRFKNLNGSPDHRTFRFLEKIRGFNEHSMLSKSDIKHLTNQVVFGMKGAKDKMSELAEECPVFLCYSNNKCRKLNAQILASIPGQSLVITHKCTLIKDTSKKPPRSTPLLEFSNALKSSITELKIGSRFMGIRNDNSRSKATGDERQEIKNDFYFYNGIMGKIVNYDTYLTESGEEKLELEVEYEEYPGERHFLYEKVIEFKTDNGARTYEYRGIPIITGDAITIHKAQGKTFESVVIDWEDLQTHPEPGMAYVALSRCRYWKKMYIMVDPVAGLRHMDSCILTDKRVCGFDIAIHNRKENLPKQIDDFMVNSFREYLQKFRNYKASTCALTSDECPIIRLKDRNCKMFMIRNKPDRISQSSFDKLIMFDAETRMVRTCGFKKQTKVKGIQPECKILSRDVNRHEWYSCYARIYFPSCLRSVYKCFSDGEYSGLMNLILEHCTKLSNTTLNTKTGEEIVENHYSIDLFWVDQIVYEAWEMVNQKFGDDYYILDKTAHNPNKCILIPNREDAGLEVAFFKFLVMGLKGAESRFLEAPKWDNMMTTTRHLKKKGEKITHICRMLKACKKGYSITAANGAGFDFQWFQQYFMKESLQKGQKYTFTPLLRANAIIGGSLLSEIDWIGCGTTKNCKDPFGHRPKKREFIIFQFHDLLRLLTPGSSLKKNHMSYCSSKEYSKDIFPHKLVLNTPLEESFDPCRVPCAEDYFDGDIEYLWKYHKLDKKAAAITTPFTQLHLMISKGLVEPTVVQQLVKYNYIDVQMMDDLYRELDKLCIDNVHQPAVAVPTCTSLATQMFLNVTAHSEYSSKLFGGKHNLYNDGKREQDRKAAKNLVLKNILPTVLQHPTHEQEQMLRKAIYGGRCLRRVCWLENEYTDGPDPEHYDDVKSKYLVAMDINSMYGECLRKHHYPVGPASKLSNGDIRELSKRFCNKQWDPELKSDMAKLKSIFLDGNSGIGKFFCLEIDGIPNCYNIEPSVPRKDKDEKIQWDNMPFKNQTYVSIHIYLFLRSGGIITKIHKGICWNDSLSFPVFKPYMEKILKGKSDGDQMNAVKKHSGDAKRSFYKLLGNSLYGGTLQKDHYNSTIICKEVTDFSKFYDDYDYLTHQFVDTNTFIFVGQKRERVALAHAKTLSYLGAYVLAYSHMMFDDFVDIMYEGTRYSGCLSSIQNQMYYSDTDSFYVLPSMVDKLQERGQIMDTPISEWEKKIVEKRGSTIKPDGFVKDDYQAKGHSCIREWNVRTGKPSKILCSKIYSFCSVAKKFYSLKYLTFPRPADGFPNGQFVGKNAQKGVPNAKKRSTTDPFNFIAVRYRYDDIIGNVKKNIRWMWRRHDNDEYLPNYSNDEKVKRAEETGFMPNAFSSSFLKSGLRDDCHSNYVYQDIINRGANWSPSRARQHVRWVDPKTQKLVIQYTVPNGWKPMNELSEFKFEFCKEKVFQYPPKRKRSSLASTSSTSSKTVGPTKKVSKEELIEYFQQNYQINIQTGNVILEEIQKDALQENSPILHEDSETESEEEEKTVINNADNSETESDQEMDIDYETMAEYRRQVREANANIAEHERSNPFAVCDDRSESELLENPEYDEIPDDEAFEDSPHYSSNPFIESEASEQ